MNQNKVDFKIRLGGFKANLYHNMTMAVLLEISGWNSTFENLKIFIIM